MEDHDTTVVERLVGEDPPESPLEALAAKRRVISETKETFIPVPGYDREPPMLLVRYRLLEGPELARMADKIRRETRQPWQRQILAAVDTFIAACVGFWVDNGDGLPKELTYKGEQIMHFDDTLAEALQYKDALPDPATARSVVFALFANNDAAIAQHNFLLNRWFQDTSLDVSEEMLAGNL